MDLLAMGKKAPNLSPLSDEIVVIDDETGLTDNFSPQEEAELSFEILLSEEGEYQPEDLDLLTE